MSTSTVKKSATSKTKSSKSKNGKAPPPPLKVVIRRLPHDMAEDVLLSALTAAAADAGMGERGGSWDILYFAPGKISKKRGKITSAAYLRIDRGRGLAADMSLIKLRAAVLASPAFPQSGAASSKDKEKLGDKATLGPSVEPAPYQKTFKLKPKRDPRVNTIEKDADFKAFCETLNKPPVRLPNVDLQADSRESETKEEVKPSNALIDFLNERGAKRMKEPQRIAPVNTSASSSSRGSRRASPRSSGSSGTSTSFSGGNSEVAGQTGTTQRTASYSGNAFGRQGSDEARAPVADPGKGKAKDSDKERGKSRSSRSSSNASRPPPPPGSQKGAGISPQLSTTRTETMSKPTESSRAPPKPPIASGSASGAEPAKGRSSTKSSSRTANKSSKSGTVAPSVPQPSAILIKQKDKSVPVAVSTTPAASSANESSVLSSGSGGGGGGGKGWGGGSSGRSKGSGGGGF